MHLFHSQTIMFRELSTVQVHLHDGKFVNLIVFFHILITRLMER